MARESSSTETEMLVRQYDPGIQELINAARSMIRTAFPGAAETADPKSRLLGYSYGPGYKGTVATLILSKNGVKIGIPFGASLPDPAGLLAGQGKVHRHVAVTAPAQLKASALKALLKKSLRAWRERAGGSGQAGAGRRDRSILKRLPGAPRDTGSSRAGRKALTRG